MVQITGACDKLVFWPPGLGLNVTKDESSCKKHISLDCEQKYEQQQLTKQVKKFEGQLTFARFRLLNRHGRQVLVVLREAAVRHHQRTLRHVLSVRTQTPARFCCCCYCCCCRPEDPDTVKCQRSLKFSLKNPDPRQQPQPQVPSPAVLQGAVRHPGRRGTDQSAPRLHRLGADKGQ